MNTTRGVLEIPVSGASFDMTDIDWRRMAEPQTDEYDSRVTLNLACQNGYARREPNSEVTIFDGAVAVRNDSETLGPGHLPAPPGHKNINAASELIRFWPA